MEKLYLYKNSYSENYGEDHRVILVAAKNAFKAMEIMKSKNDWYKDENLEMIVGAEYTGKEGVIFEE